jgi:hypothetical protein
MESRPEAAPAAPTAGTEEDHAVAPAPAAPTSAEVEAAAEVLVTVRTRRQIAAAVAWNSAVALAVLLTLATIALTIAGILGAQL